jgi:hypothetical protein
VGSIAFVLHKVLTQAQEQFAHGGVVVYINIIILDAAPKSFRKLPKLKTIRKQRLSFLQGEEMSKSKFKESQIEHPSPQTIMVQNVRRFV